MGLDALYSRRVRDCPEAQTWPSSDSILSISLPSRFFSEAYCIIDCISYIHPSIASVEFVWVQFFFWWLSGTSSSVLCILRILAMYPRSIFVKCGIVIIWSCWFLCPLMIAFGPGSSCSQFEPETSCHAWSPLDAICTTSLILNDTIVFLGISCRLAMNAIVGETWHDRLRSFFTGKGLFRISKVLLRSGQLYYGVALCMVVGVTILNSVYVPYVPLMGPAYCALASSMTCRVFRMVILCDVDSCALNTGDIERVFDQV